MPEQSASANGHLDCPYEDIASEDLDRTAQMLVDDKKIRVRVIDTGRTVSMQVIGICPRCAGKLDQTAVIDLPAAAVRGGSAGASSNSVQSDFLCECGETHTGAPTDARCCGANFTIVAPAP